MSKRTPLLTVTEICALRRNIEQDPANTATSGRHPYTLAARRKLAAIDQKITAVMEKPRVAPHRRQI